MSHEPEPTTDLDPSCMRCAVAVFKSLPIVFVTPVAVYLTSDRWLFCAAVFFGSLAVLASWWADEQWRSAPRAIAFTNVLLLGVSFTWLSTGPSLAATDIGAFLSISSGAVHDIEAGFPWPWLNGQAGFGFATGYANGFTPDSAAYYGDVAVYTALLLGAGFYLPVLSRISMVWWVHGAALITAATSLAVVSWRVLFWEFRFWGN